MMAAELSGFESKHRSKNGRPTCGGIVQCDYVGELILLLPDPGSRGQKGTGYRIPDPGSATLGELLSRYRWVTTGKWRNL
jgi:hypothetical protein